MKSTVPSRFLFLAFFMAAVLRPAARAAVAERVTYQGNLRESGLLVTGSRSMTFRLYDAPSAGTLLWASAAMPITVSTGVFRAVLTPSGLNWESALWLEVEVAGTVLSPREELTTAPFAANALLHSGKRYTSAGAAPASPGVGDLWFDTGSGALKFWSGSGWTSTAGSGAAHAATHAGAGADPITSLGAYTLTGNITMSPGTNLAAGAGSLGVSVSTHLVVAGRINPSSNLAVGGPGFSVAFASAVTAGWFYGDGAGLSNISASPPVNMATTDTGQTITGGKIFTAAQSLPTVSSTMTIQGNAFSVGGSSFTVGGGSAAVAYRFGAGSFVGNGAGLTGVSAANMAAANLTAGTLIPSVLLNAGSLTNGPVASSILPSTVAYTSAANAFTAAQSLPTVSSTMTIQGNAFSVGGASFTVVGGNVGIGTAAPGSKLSVNGSIDAANNRVSGVADPVANTDAANKQWVMANAGRAQYMGQTPASTGLMGGPFGANALCNAVYPGSFLCRQSDLLRAGLTSLPSGSWIQPEGIQSGGGGILTTGVTSGFNVGTGACGQWLTDLGTNFGPAISTNGGFSAVTCNISLPLSCCK